MSLGVAPYAWSGSEKLALLGSDTRKGEYAASGSGSVSPDKGNSFFFEVTNNAGTRRRVVLSDESLGTGRYKIQWYKGKTFRLAEIDRISKEIQGGGYSIVVKSGDTRSVTARVEYRDGGSFCLDLEAKRAASSEIDRAQLNLNGPACVD